jgi:DGQHR domain-containing protein
MNNETVERFGREIVIKEVLVGKNLNVQVIRGFATLDQLAFISAPDVYNQLTNALGTQRDPDLNHARQVLDYAITSLSEEPETSPRAFPEIILNARDKSVVSLTTGHNENEIDFSSSSGEENFFTGTLTIHVHLIDNHRDKDPQISRVDGNHRLLMVAKRVEDDPEEVFPSVPFSMFVGLTADQERALFRDINGEQKSMDTAHLDTIKLRLQGPSQLLQTEGGQALWIAKQLSTDGYPFENLIFFGGDKKAFKQAGMAIPPVKINALKSAVLTTLKDSKQMSALLNSEGIDLPSEESRLLDARTRLTLLNRYWTAVRSAFPEAWQDRTNFVLMQAIGLNAFSRLGAVVIDAQIEAQKLTQQHFDVVLKHISGKVDLSRTAWAGYAGLSGAKIVFQKLNEAKLDGFNKTLVLGALIDPDKSPLDE